MSNKQTFWMLLDKYNIEIPIIQRDYAQGRSTEKATQIRKKFVSHLFTLISDDTRSDDLDFIYGTVKNKTLVLLDGQQRLTTLFLLHWYLAVANSSLPEAKTKLEKFSYKTRITSKDFVDSLIKLGNTFDLRKLDCSLSSKIKDSFWFFSVWSRDPTVQSMLTMLDEIHDVFGPSIKESNELWANLISHENPPITFHFLNMEEFSLTDELYIKMNARGRPLTEFENFKAWLQSSLTSSSIDNDFKGFWDSLDKSWTDVFWRVRPDGVYEIDDLFLSCFKNLALFNLSKGMDIAPKKLSSEDDELISKLRSNNYISIEVYDERKLFGVETLKALHNFLDSIHFFQKSDDSSVQEVWQRCEPIFENGLNKDAYLDKARFFALFLYLSRVQVSETEEHQFKSMLEDFSDWFEVCQRLINNTAFDISIDFARSVQAVDHLSFLIGDTLGRLKVMSVQEFKFFNEIQREEEVLKADLITRDSSWKALFKDYEKHNYFYGQIGFLIKSCLDQEKGEYSQQQFIARAQIASVLFSDDLIEDGEFLFQRALLSIGDYLISSGSNYSFCRSTKTSARYRYENWRAVFNNHDKRELLIQLIDRIEIGHVAEGLRKILEDSKCNDWRQHFINHPETIAYCKARKVRFPKNESDEIYLLNGERLSGRYYGLRTYVLYLLIKHNENSELVEIQKFLKPYYEAIGEGESPGVRVEPYLNGRLDIEYSNGDFVMRYLNSKDEEIDLNEASIGIKALRTLMNNIKSLEGNVS